VRITNSNGCVGAVSAPATITVATMPAAATVTRVSAATVCQGTDVVFRASGTAGSTFTWLGTAGTASGTGNGTLTVSGSATGTKSVSAYARLTSSGTTCQSANAATVTAVVNPIPTITLTSATGTANQTVNAGTEMTAISYTANNSATITLNSGSSFPTGVSGNANGSSYTISGTPSTTGTFGYSFTAVASGCSSTAAVGTLTVNAVPTPSGAASTQTWSYGTLTWSDRLTTAAPSQCASTASFSASDAPPAQYLVKGANTYYNWPCVTAGAAELCPSPWRVPTNADYQNLRSSGAPALGRLWGFGGGVKPPALGYSVDEYHLLWTSSDRYTGTAHCGMMSEYSNMSCASDYNIGYQIRCVK
jgi:hypothetical protein